MTRRFREIRWAASAAGLLAAGCSVYDARFEFEPAPVDVEAYLPGAEGEAPVRTLVSVTGVRRPDKKTGLPLCVEVRMRVENTSSWSVELDPKSVVLHSAGLLRFPDPIAIQQVLRVEPGTTGDVEAFFPFPEGTGVGDVDLNGVNVRWTLSIDGRPVTSSASFRRRPEAYYDRYDHRIGVGYHAYPG